MHKLILLALVFILISCTSKLTETSESRFVKFVSNVPLKDLPINFYCGLTDGDDPQSSDFNNFAQFIPPDQNIIYGVIRKTHEYTLIIYGESGDSIYPALYSYNKVGKRIDSLSLVLSPCGAADGSMIPSSTAHIDKNLKITLSDTIKYIHYLDNSIYVSDSLKVSSLTYSVDKNGLIIKE